MEKLSRDVLTGEMRSRIVPDSERAAEKAMLLFSRDSVTVQDTQGIETFRLELGEGDPGSDVAGGYSARREQERQAVIRWERMHCNDCGVRVWEGAIFCRECKPYGFWHWLSYFSVVAWRRCTPGNGRG